MMEDSERGFGFSLGIGGVWAKGLIEVGFVVGVGFDFVVMVVVAVVESWAEVITDLMSDMRWL